MPAKTKEEYNAYMKEYMKERARRRRKLALSQLGSECVVCGSSGDLDFDHIDPTTKVNSIASLVASASEELLQAELMKCQLLCKECHLEKSRANGDFTHGGGGCNKILNPLHGTWGMYGREKCRCEPCRQWRRDYRLKLVDARGNPR